MLRKPLWTLNQPTRTRYDQRTPGICGRDPGVWSPEIFLPTSAGLIPCVSGSRGPAQPFVCKILFGNASPNLAAVARGGSNSLRLWGSLPLWATFGDFFLPSRIFGTPFDCSRRIPSSHQGRAARADANPTHYFPEGAGGPSKVRPSIAQTGGPTTQTFSRVSEDFFLASSPIGGSRSLGAFDHGPVAKDNARMARQKFVAKFTWGVGRPEGHLR